MPWSAADRRLRLLGKNVVSFIWIRTSQMRLLFYLEYYSFNIKSLRITTLRKRKSLIQVANNILKELKNFGYSSGSLVTYLHMLERRTMQQGRRKPFTLLLWFGVPLISTTHNLYQTIYIHHDCRSIQKPSNLIENVLLFMNSASNDHNYERSGMWLCITNITCEQ